MKAILLALILSVLPCLCMAERDRNSLEQFELSQLQLISVSKPRCDGTRFAYVRDPAGYLHHLEVGEYAGKSEGRVRKIAKDRITIMELVQTTNGEWVERPEYLQLMGKRGPADLD